MISYTRPHYQWPFTHAVVRVAGDSGWSAPFQLDKPAAMSIDSQVGGGAYELGVECRFAPAPFHRTRLVFLSCTLVLVNDTPHDVQYMQTGTTPSSAELARTVVRAGQRISFHWPSRRHKRLLQLRVLRPADESAWWSTWRPSRSWCSSRGGARRPP